MNNAVLRDHLEKLLQGGSAYMKCEEILTDFPVSLAASKLEGVSHTPWQLLEHIRLAQWDIVEFTRDPAHLSPDFPDGYWPDSDSPPDQDAWGGSVDAILEGLQTMIDLVRDHTIDLFEPIPHGTGQTVLREALLVADHNAYHLGQMMMLRRALE